MLAAKVNSSDRKINSIDHQEILESEHIHNDYYCPICDEQLIYVTEGSDGTVAHFRHKVEADHPSLSESREHVNGKINVKENLENHEVSDPRTMISSNNIELEKVIRPNFSIQSSKEFFDREFEVADICVNDKFVFEIQMSRIGFNEIKKRTEFYNKNGYKVCWILGDKYINKDNNDRYVVSETIYKLFNSFEKNLFFYHSDLDKIFAARFMNFDAKTRCYKLKVIEVSNPRSDTTYGCNFGIKEFDNPFSDTFGLQNYSYNTYDEAKDFESFLGDEI